MGLGLNGWGDQGFGFAEKGGECLKIPWTMDL